jgi:hypothetical protein
MPEAVGSNDAHQVRTYTCGLTSTRAPSYRSRQVGSNKISSGPGFLLPILLCLLTPKDLSPFASPHYRACRRHFLTSQGDSGCALQPKKSPRRSAYFLPSPPSLLAHKPFLPAQLGLQRLATSLHHPSFPHTSPSLSPLVFTPSRNQEEICLPRKPRRRRRSLWVVLVTA